MSQVECCIYEAGLDGEGEETRVGLACTRATMSLGVRLPASLAYLGRLRRE